MKIIVLQDYLRSGGTERHSILLAREFAGLGHEAQLVTFRPGGRLSEMAGPGHRSLQPFDTGIDWFGPRPAPDGPRGPPGHRALHGQDRELLRRAHPARRAASRRLPTKVVATLRAGGRILSLYYSSIKNAAHVVANSIEAANDS